MINTCRNCGKPNGAYAGFPQGDRCTCRVGVWSSLKEMTEHFEQAKAEVDAKIEAALVVEREELLKEILALKHKVVGTREYVQGRWDLLGEVQDVILARNKK